MSKSKGTFVRAATYLKHLDPAYLRYFYASKLTPRVDDLDMNLEEFASKVNSDIVGKVVNLASRCARFVESTGLSPEYPDDGKLFEAGVENGIVIAAAYDDGDYNQAMRSVMTLVDRANAYVDYHAPWSAAKNPDRQREVQDTCTVALNLFRQIVIYLAPVLPRLAEQTGELFNSPIRHWDDAQTPLVGTRIGKFHHLIQRVDPAKVQAMIDDSRVPDTTAQREQGPAYTDTAAALEAEPLAAQITIDDFNKVDLRVARVLAAESVPDARKLLKLTVSLGGDVRRTVFAGIKEAYQPEALIGRLVILAANLAPRTMKFGVSEGMVCASGPGGKDVFLLAVDTGAVPGQRVH
jgi:methionyl-tRNA synthetase